MSTTPALIQDFLAQKRIAVVGVSREPGQVANLIVKKLQETGYEVYAVNPNARNIDSQPCYPDVRSTPTRPDAVMIVTKPDVTDKVVHDCAEAGISRVWMHCSVIHGVRSTSDTAVKFCQEHNISVIPAGCPLMYIQPVDVFHKFMCWWMQRRGDL
jgi:uncharacterized protein